jgi:hypothetical protein
MIKIKFIIAIFITMLFISFEKKISNLSQILKIILIYNRGSQNLIRSLIITSNLLFCES